MKPGSEVNSEIERTSVGSDKTVCTHPVEKLTSQLTYLTVGVGTFHAISE